MTLKSDESTKAVCEIVILSTIGQPGSGITKVMHLKYCT